LRNSGLPPRTVCPSSVVSVMHQDVQAVLPELVQPIYEGRYLGVNYIELIPLLIEAVRDLNSKADPGCDTFRSQLQALANNIAAMESELEEMKSLVALHN
jgi:hypothetical protein